MNSFKDNYFDWLCDLIGGKEYYRLLLYKLLNIEYYWIVQYDDDRAKDGKNLRKTYLELMETYDETGLDYISVLEVLIALAISCEDNIMSSKEYGDRTSEWFWMMLNNLGLLKYSDAEWTVKSENEIANIVDIWLSRCYKFDGKGGAFPLKKCHTDQKKVDLWSQLHAYLQENYDF